MNGKETKGIVKSDVVNPKVDGIATSEKTETPSLSPYEIFQRCIKRAENLISIKVTTEDIPGVSDQHYCDCYRAAVVLSISALDAFIRTIVVAEIRSRIVDTSKQLPQTLSIYIKNLMNQDDLLEAARKYNFLERLEEVVRNDFETKSFQGEWKISSFLEMVGHKDIFSEVATKADINEKNLRRKLSVFTNRRHLIAHSGDYDLSKNPHAENEINGEYASECIQIVTLFASTIDKIIEEKRK